MRKEGGLLFYTTIRDAEDSTIRQRIVHGAFSLCISKKDFVGAEQILRTAIDGFDSTSDENLSKYFHAKVLLCTRLARLV